MSPPFFCERKKEANGHHFYYTYYCSRTTTVGHIRVTKRESKSQGDSDVAKVSLLLLVLHYYGTTTTSSIKLWKPHFFLLFLLSLFLSYLQVLFLFCPRGKGAKSAFFSFSLSKRNTNGGAKFFLPSLSLAKQESFVLFPLYLVGTVVGRCHFPDIVLCAAVKNTQCCSIMLGCWGYLYRTCTKQDLDKNIL